MIRQNRIHKLLHRDDIIWVHDYHLIPMARFLWIARLDLSRGRVARRCTGITSIHPTRPHGEAVA
jgi:hypothetical protein